VDEYTKKTKAFLEQRFRDSDEKGVYESHAPIYGFSKKHIFLGLYKNNYSILKEIEKLNSQYSIRNFLEVGSAEGYTANLVDKIFGFKVRVIDLSSEAVKRAKEIYQLDGIVADAQSLDFIKTGSFDLVLCSETLEHLPHPEKAFKELLRIAKKVLIITVPAAKDKKEKESFMPSNEPHAHLNIFTKEDLKKVEFYSKVRGISFKWLDKIESLFTMDGKPELVKRSGLYRFCRLLFLPLRRFYGENMAKLFIKLDYWTGSISVFNAITYMGLYLKTQPDFNKKIQRFNILDFMLKKDRVDQHFINKG